MTTGVKHSDAARPTRNIRTMHTSGSARVQKRIRDVSQVQKLSRRIEKKKGAAVPKGQLTA